MQHMRFALFRGNIFLNLIREEYHAHFIVVLDSGESECSGYLGDHIALHLRLATEIAAARHIYEQHHGQFAFFFKNLDIRP